MTRANRKNGKRMVSRPVTDKPAHDAGGNMTCDGLQAYTYDAWNRLTGVARAYGDANTSSTIATIAYDGLNRRTTKTIAGRPGDSILFS